MTWQMGIPICTHILAAWKAYQGLYFAYVRSIGNSTSLLWLTFSGTLVECDLLKYCSLHVSKSTLSEVETVALLSSLKMALVIAKPKFYLGIECGR